MAEVKFVETTTSLDPFTFDDDLIPCNALCCNVTSLFLKTPDCYGGHGLGGFLCCNQEFTCCKPGRNDKEYVVVQDGMCSIVKPENCCKGATQCFCIDSRYAFFDFAKGAPLDPEFPCLVNILGLTLFYKWTFAPQCCKKWGEIKNTPIPAATA